jgi:hypothetical protein
MPVEVDIRLRLKMSDKVYESTSHVGKLVNQIKAGELQLKMMEEWEGVKVTATADVRKSKADQV